MDAFGNLLLQQSNVCVVFKLIMDNLYSMQCGVMLITRHFLVLKLHLMCITKQKEDVRLEHGKYGKALDSKYLIRKLDKRLCSCDLLRPVKDLMFTVSFSKYGTEYKQYVLQFTSLMDKEKIYV